jgi:putative ABC transport system permease protein
MKTIDVKNQPTLSVNRTFEISLNGTRYRLFRSVVTVVVIAVAIAFMMNVVCEAISTQAIARAARARTAQQRLATWWSARLSLVATPEATLRNVAGAGDALQQELQGLGGMTADRMAAYRTHVQQAVRYLDFFAALPYATRRSLVYTAEGTAIFDRLQEQDARVTFTEAMDKYKVRVPDGKAGLFAFVDAWDATVKNETAAIINGHAQAIAALNPQLKGRMMHEALADADGTFGDAVAQAGFVSFDTATRAAVADQARQTLQAAFIEDSIGRIEARQQLASRIGGSTVPGDITLKVLWQTLSDRGTADWYLKYLGEKLQLSQEGLTPERVTELARSKKEMGMLDNAVRITADASGTSRMTWLVLVSLLVCVVGISNAMLMSVTERFREIATLKCLGALDTFIMTLFLLEACLLGLVGGVIGGLAGSVIGFGRMLATFGGKMLFLAFPAGPWLLGLVAAIVAGVVLAALAGVYPSYMAARLAPMEAMRIE